MNADEQPMLSVVIPTMGRPILLQTLDSLIRVFQFKRIEIIVAGRIPDPRVEGQLIRLIDQFPNMHHLSVQYETGDSSRKKNIGAAEARSELIAFLDDDVIVAQDWVEHIVALFDDPEVGLVSGPSLVPIDVPLFARLAGVTLQSRAAGYVSERYLRGHDDPRQVTWSRIIGCNMVYRRTVLEKIGMFNPDFWPGEEMIAAFRAQSVCKLMFHPEAWVYHYPRATPGRFWKQIYGYGATRIRLIRAGVEFEPTTIIPGLWVLSLMILIPWAVFSRLGLALLLADVLLYILADVWITLVKVLETRHPKDLLIFFVVPIMHLSYGLAEWHEIFFPNRDLSEKWKSIPTSAGESGNAER